jgi:DNA-binding FadR family transcriptional regulator
MRTESWSEPVSWLAGERVYPDDGDAVPALARIGGRAVLLPIDQAGDGDAPAARTDVSSQALQAIHLVAHHLRVFGALGSEAAARAAARCDEADLQLLQTALRAIDRGILHGSDGSREYVDFHLAVADASANPSLLNTLAAMRHTHVALARVTRACEARRLDFALEVRRELEDILFSIEMGDVVSARRAGRNHMLGAVRRVFEVEARFWRQKGADLARALRQAERHCAAPGRMAGRAAC